MTVRRGDRGQAGGLEVLPFGLLIFVSGALLIANMWGVVDAKFAADAAAREAARYVVETASTTLDASELRAGAEGVARVTFDDHGRRGPVSVELRPDHGPLLRCTRIQVTVSSQVPAIRLPFIGGFGNAFDIVATHSEIVDPARSGVLGRADCVR